jgi:hypothetical protein
MRKTVTRSLRETPFAAHGKVPIERFEVETRQSSAAEPRRCKGKLNRFNCASYVIDSRIFAATYLHRHPNVKARLESKSCLPDDHPKGHVVAS